MFDLRCRLIQNQVTDTASGRLVDRTILIAAYRRVRPYTACVSKIVVPHLLSAYNTSSGIVGRRLYDYSYDCSSIIPRSSYRICFRCTIISPQNVSITTRAYSIGEFAIGHHRPRTSTTYSPVSTDVTLHSRRFDLRCVCTYGPSRCPVQGAVLRCLLSSLYHSSRHHRPL